MTKLSPQQQLIMDYLKDGEWHCMANPGFYMKDDRKRISDLNKIGKAENFEIEGAVCDGRCGIQHQAQIKMRRLVRSKGECCRSYQIFKEHARDCVNVQPKVAKFSDQLKLNI